MIRQYNKEIYRLLFQRSTKELQQICEIYSYEKRFVYSRRLQKITENKRQEKVYMAVKLSYSEVNP
jgi:hypothetical protein